MNNDPRKVPTAHPRQHALTIAAATHLHNAGHLSAGHRDQIEQAARSKLDQHKKTKGKPVMKPFGGLAP